MRVDNFLWKAEVESFLRDEGRELRGQEFWRAEEWSLTLGHKYTIYFLDSWNVVSGIYSQLPQYMIWKEIIFK